jgi:putative ABC transport system ATP-binding protein
MSAAEQTTAGTIDPGPRPAVVEARHVTHIYGTGDTQVTALDDVSFKLYPAEVVLLTGPSGSGKSTLLAILSGLLRPTSGEVFALEQNLGEMSERQREQFRLKHCGFIFQDYHLLRPLKARQQLELVLQWGEGMSVQKARPRARDMLMLLGLGRRQHLRPLELSGGEKQRVAIGRGLVKNPSFCFADEPTGALDWQRGQQVIELLRAAAHDRGVSVLIVAHDERIMPLADRVLFLDEGRLHEPAATELGAVRLEAEHAVPSPMSQEAK